MKRTIIAVSLALAGCMTHREYITVPAPQCSSPESCKMMWDAAQLFVARNSDQKIQIATDVLIETYNPTYSTNIAMRVTKEHLGGGLYKISADAFCSNPFGCNVHPANVINRFNSSVAAAGEP